MTGYGKAEKVLERRSVKVEIRSLNSKFFDLNLRLPSGFREKEMPLRNLMAEKLQRGKIDCSVEIENTGVQKNFTINKELATGYFNDLKELATSLKQPTDNLLDSILKLPDVIVAGKNENIEQEWNELSEVINSALKEHDHFRQQEGKKLEKEFEKMIANILDLLKKVEGYDADRLQTVKTRINESLAANVPDEKIDKNRFEQELDLLFGAHGFYRGKSTPA